MDIRRINKARQKYGSKLKPLNRADRINLIVDLLSGIISSQELTNVRKRLSNTTNDVVFEASTEAITDTLTRISRSSSSVGKLREAFLHNPVNAVNNVINSKRARILVKKKRNSRNPSKKLYPWLVVKLSNGRPQIQDITVFSLFNPQQWTIGYKMSIAAPFPQAKMTKNPSSTIGERNINATQQLVANWCSNTGGQRNQGWCRRKPPGRHTEKRTGGKEVTLLKNGTAGISVAEIFSKFKIGGEVRQQNYVTYKRSYLNMKRNGDYGQIFSCKYINDNTNVYVQRPFIEDIANKTNLELLLIQNAQTFVYQNTIFWTGDRPACFLSLLLKIPFVYAANRTEYYFWQPGTRSVKSPVKNTNKGSSLMIDLIGTYDKENRRPPTTNNIPMWFLKMAIADTCHDFNVGARTGTIKNKRDIRSIRFNMKELMLRTARNLDRPVPGTKSLVEYTDEVWGSIISFQNQMGAMLRSPSLTEPVPELNPKLNLGNSEGMARMRVRTASGIRFMNHVLEKDAAIVHDIGEVPLWLKPRVILLAAKLTDPGN